ncbi:xanthine dehydrogenase family protein molybdopterin-binding subunit [Maricurvus nonylphenolicus]|uniref:xanthine dehydrogenase family protein molybdopterin-binding subunit n=1 Tax=Maricurvus nonylphenolicus TaxID=1008307 RepID=UPI0036F3FE68
MKVQKSSRRDFMKMLGVVGGGLIVGVNLTACSDAKLPKAITSGSLVVNAFLQIREDGSVHFYLPSSEMGQGVWTGLATLVAEELNTPPESINICHGLLHADYTNTELGIQATAASSSMRVFYQPIRQAAANVGLMLRRAASQQLNVPLSSVALSNGKIAVENNEYKFSTFIKTAAVLEQVPDAPLKNEEDFIYIGKQEARLDAISKVTGEAEFGIDVDIPNLRKAVISRCPVVGGKPKYFNRQAVLDRPGVEAVFTVEHGVAIVADSYWNARSAVNSLNVEWQLPALKNYDTIAVFSEMSSAILNQEGTEAILIGEGSSALVQAENTFSAEYQLPFLAHATMEPLNCAVHIHGGECDIWVGAQSNQIARDCAARFAGVSKDKVRVHPYFLGGGFGRRAHIDFIIEAVKVAAIADVPVQLMWSREDDIRHDYYRPASVAKLTAGVDKRGQISVWRADRAGANILPYMIDDAVDVVSAGVLPLPVADWVSKRGFDVFDGLKVDEKSVEGLFEGYDVPHLEVRNYTVDPGLRVGFWRGVGHSGNAFAKEVFIDEIAIGLNIDPIEFRLQNLKSKPRMTHVVKLAAEKSAWKGPSVNGRVKGFACHESYGSRVAQVVELSVNGGSIEIHKILCVIDCGRVVTPDNVRAQMESSIIFALTAALYGSIDIESGAVKQSNFHDYPLLRLDQTPEIEVHLIDSDESPAGVGEPGLPPVAPAIANALYSATGKRFRTLPLTL